MRVPRHPALVALLSLPALLYSAVVRARNRHYDREGSCRQAEIPVLSVGNLTVGGTGKTPIVAWLARRLLEEGRRPAVVSRGYRGTAGDGPLIVSRGRGALCSPSACGDEPFMLAETLPDTVVVVGSERLPGVQAAAEAGAEVAILDDGFQHRRLMRDLDLVLLDAGDPFGNGWLLPAGSLREPVSGLNRADAVVITRSHPDDDLGTLERTIRIHNTDGPIVRAGHRILGFFDPRGRRTDPPQRAVAFCGIGNPARFRLDLDSQHLEIVKLQSFGDHHVFSLEEIRRLCDLAVAERACLVTTEKDLVRLGATGNLSGHPPIVAMRIESAVHDSCTLLQLVRGAIGEGRR